MNLSEFVNVTQNISLPVNQHAVRYERSIEIALEVGQFDETSSSLPERKKEAVTVLFLAVDYNIFDLCVILLDVLC